MPITVVIRSGARDGEPSPSITLDAPMIVLGRGEGCEVRLPDASVSHRHATIRQRAGEYLLQDEGSTNGTFVAEARLGVQAPRILRHGDIVRLGRIFVEIRLDALLATSQAPQATKEIALGLVANALTAQGEEGSPRIVAVEGPDRGKVLVLEDPGRVYVMGRGRDADLVLDDADASRRHVQVVRRGELLLVRDLGSKNGAHLGAAFVATDRDASWRIGEALQLGSSVFVYEHPAAIALAELDHAPDEKIEEDEIIEPPPSELDSPTGADTSAPSIPPPDGPAGAAPIAEMPEASPAMDAMTRPRSGWTGTDVMVVLLAVGVLGLSIVGMYWLFRG